MTLAQFFMTPKASSVPKKAGAGGSGLNPPPGPGGKKGLLAPGGGPREWKVCENTSSKVSEDVRYYSYSAN